MSDYIIVMMHINDQEAFITEVKRLGDASWLPLGGVTVTKDDMLIQALYKA